MIFYLHTSVVLLELYWHKKDSGEGYAVVRINQWVFVQVDMPL